MKEQVCIVGAGVAGLAAARKLQDRGIPVFLVDKGRGVGGRVATRWTGQRDDIRGRWDHGAQFATFRSRDLITQLEAWHCRELMRPWLPSHEDSELIRERPLQGMNAFAKALAEGLEIHRGERVIGLEKSASSWKLHADTGKTFEASRLICTLPVPQFLELVDSSALKLDGDETKILQSVQYDPCLSLLAELEGPSGMDDKGYCRLRTGILETLIDQQLKGISPSPTLVALANTSFSREWFVRDRSTAASVMRAAVQEQLQTRISSVQIHGWKYAKARQRIPSNCLQLESGIVLAGDGFAAGDSTARPELSPRIESAMLSGLSATGLM